MKIGPLMLIVMGAGDDALPDAAVGVGAGFGSAGVTGTAEGSTMDGRGTSACGVTGSLTGVIGRSTAGSNLTAASGGVSPTA